MLKCGDTYVHHFNRQYLCSCKFATDRRFDNRSFISYSFVAMMLLFLNIVVSLLTPLRSSFAQQYCLSTSASTQYEHIESISIGQATFETGNNDGYLQINNQPITLDRTDNYPITLTPGHSTIKYKEVWSIWIDYNRDYQFDNSELVLQTASDQVIFDHINIDSEQFSEGETVMRVSMRYNVAAEPCENFLNGEVEDYSIMLRDQACTSYHTQDFQSDFDGWIDGGTDCALSQEHTPTGDLSVRLRDDSGLGSSLRSPILKENKGKNTTVSFSYYANSMEDGEQLVVELINTDTDQATLISSITSGHDMVFNEWTNMEYQLDVSSPAQRLQFRSHASDNGDQVYIDNVVFSRCRVQEHTSDLPHQQLEAEDNTTSEDEEGNSAFFTDINVNFYPSPTDQYLNVKMESKPSNQANLTYAIMDLDGNLIATYNAIDVRDHGGVIDVSELPNGVHLVMTINMGRIIDRQKIVILHR